MRSLHARSNGRSRDRSGRAAARAGLLLALALLPCGCRTPVVHPADPGLLARPELAFVQDGVTTRADLLLRLGEPAATFEDRRVLTYQLDRREDGSLRVRLPANRPHEFTSWALSLVLVFDEEGILERHSLVVAE